MLTKAQTDFYLGLSSVMFDLDVLSWIKPHGAWP